MSGPETACHFYSLHGPCIHKRPDETPEAQVCERLGIIYGAGTEGEKKINRISTTLNRYLATWGPFLPTALVTWYSQRKP